MLGIIGASGKLGSATLSALLEHNLLPASQIICTTSATSPSDQRWQSLASQGVQVRHATFDDPASITTALDGCTRLFLVSSPRITLDYNDAPPGSGREKGHIGSIDAALKAGVTHIYYTSLAFGNPSKAAVMAAHIRTEAYLKELSELRYTIIREGLYNESWPLYFGHYNPKDDDRMEVVVAGDGKISWTAISDLGLANALTLVADEEYANRTLYLSNTQEPRSLKEIAELVSEVKGKEIRVRVLPRDEYERLYVEERKMDADHIKWWASTYEALKENECDIKDTRLERLLALKGKVPTRVEDTVKGMCT